MRVQQARDLIVWTSRAGEAPAVHGFVGGVSPFCPEGVAVKGSRAMGYGCWGGFKSRKLILTLTEPNKIQPPPPPPPQKKKNKKKNSRTLEPTFRSYDNLNPQPKSP